MLEILRRQRSGSVMLVLERTGYEAVTSLLNQITAQARIRHLIDLNEIQAAFFDARQIKDEMPRIVMSNLFLRGSRIYDQISEDEAGLILAPKIPYRWFALRRNDT